MVGRNADAPVRLSRSTRHACAWVRGVLGLACGGWSGGLYGCVVSVDGCVGISRVFFLGRFVVLFQQFHTSSSLDIHVVINFLAEIVCISDNRTTCTTHNCTL